MCPHSIRLVTHGYEDIYGITMQDAKIFQSVISPKGDKNHKKGSFSILVIYHSGISSEAVLF